MNSIINVTTKHSRYDTRVFKRFTQGLSSSYKCSILVNDLHENEHNDRFKITGLKKKNKLLTLIAFLKFLNNSESSVVILHDPELLLITPFIKRNKHRVYFDSHENTPNDILIKEYIPIFLRSFVSKIYEKIERYIAYYFLHGVISPSKDVCLRMEGYKIKNYLILNFPTTDMIAKSTKQSSQNEVLEIVFVGLMNFPRGVDVLINACKSLENIRLTLIGPCYDKKMSAFIEDNLSSKIVYLGPKKIDEVLCYLDNSDIGIVAPRKSAISMDALPVKLPEYMSRGLCIVGSDIPIISSLISLADCGSVIDPESSIEMSECIQYYEENRDVLNQKKINSLSYAEENFSFEKDFNNSSGEIFGIN